MQIKAQFDGPEYDVIRELQCGRRKPCETLFFIDFNGGYMIMYQGFFLDHNSPVVESCNQEVSACRMC